MRSSCPSSLPAMATRVSDTRKAAVGPLHCVLCFEQVCLVRLVPTPRPPLCACYLNLLLLRQDAETIEMPLKLYIYHRGWCYLVRGHNQMHNYCLESPPLILTYICASVPVRCSCYVGNIAYSSSVVSNRPSDKALYNTPTYSFPATVAAE